MKRNREGYYIQTDKYSCGPIAIMNAIKWKYREEDSYLSFDDLRKKCKTSETGSNMDDVGATLNDYQIAKPIWTTSHRIMKNELNKKNALILCHAIEAKSEECHYSFVFIDEYSRIRTINNGKYYYSLKWETFVRDNLNVNEKIKACALIILKE